MYLNIYVPSLQYEGGVVRFFHGHRGQPIPSSALMSPMTQSFVAAIKDFAEHQIPLMVYAPGQEVLLAAIASRYEGLRLIIDHMNLSIVRDGNGEHVAGERSTGSFLLLAIPTSA